MNMFAEISIGIVKALIWQYMLLYVLQASLLRFIPVVRMRLRYGVVVGVVAALLLLPVIDLAVYYSLSRGTYKSAELARKETAVDSQTQKVWLKVSDGMDEKQSHNTYDLRGDVTETIAYVVWLTGSITVLLLTLHYQLRRYGLLKHSKVEEGGFKEGFAAQVERLHVARSIRVYRSNSAATVAMTGFCEPAVVIPEGIYDYDQEYISVLLAWQLAKIKLAGNVLEYICNIVNCMFFYNPAVWLLCADTRKQLRACYLEKAGHIADTKELPEIVSRHIEMDSTNVLQNIKLLMGTAVNNAVSAFRSLPKFTSSIIRSPGNAVSVLLLIAFFLIPAGIMLHHSGKRLLTLAFNYQGSVHDFVKGSLLRAARQADIYTVRNYLAKYPDMLTVCDEDGGTLLHLAAKHSNGVHLVDYLIGLGIDVHAFDNHYRKAIHCYPGSADTAKLLEIHGLRPDIFAAAGHGMVENLQQMLSDDPDLIFAVDRGGRTIPDHAAEADQIDIANMLFEKGLEPNIYWASRLGLEERLREIIAEDGYVIEENTLLPYGGPLDTAVHFGHSVVAQILLESGASPEGSLEQDQRPLRKAVWLGYSDIAKMLLDYGARPVIDLAIVDKSTREDINCSGDDILLSGFQYPSKKDFSGNRILLDLPDEGIAAIICQPSEYVPTRVSWNTDISVPAEYRLALEKGITIGGVVRDYTGKGVESAEVQLQIPANLVKHNTPSPDVMQIVKTGPEGRWHCDNMPHNLRKLAILIEHREYFDDDAYSVPAMPPPDAFRNMRAVFVLPDRIQLTGRVVDRAGRPVVAAEVKLVCNTLDRSCKTNRRGEFEFEKVPSTKVYIDIVAEGMARKLCMLEPEENIDDCEIVMSPGRTVRIKAVDAHEGKPMAGVVFNVLHWNGYSRKLMKSTDANGEIAWTDAPVEKLWLAVAAKNYQFTKLLINEDDDEYLVKLYEPVSVTGKVTDALTKEPIEKFTIFRKHLSVDLSTYEQRMLTYDGEEIVSAQGAYAISQEISEISHQLLIEADGYKPVTSEEFFDSSGNVQMDFALERQQWMKGTVQEPDGSPAAGATVMLIKSRELASMTNSIFMDEEPGRTFVADESGSFKFPEPEKGWTLVAFSDVGYHRVSRLDFQNDNNVVLRPWGRLKGSVALNQEPLRNHNVIVNPKATTIAGLLWQSYKLRTDDTGRFEIDRIAPEKYWVGLPGDNPEGFVPEIAEVEIKAGETMELTIECTQ